MFGWYRLTRLHPHPKARLCMHNSPLGESAAQLTWLTSLCTVTLVAPKWLATPCQTLWRQLSASILAFHAAKWTEEESDPGQLQRFSSIPEKAVWTTWTYYSSSLYCHFSSLVFSTGAPSPQVHCSFSAAECVFVRNWQICTNMCQLQRIKH